jgi:hypothetical protein
MARRKPIVEPGQRYISATAKRPIWVIRRVFEAGALDPHPHVELQALDQSVTVRTIALEVLLDPKRYTWLPAGEADAQA